MTFPNLKGKHAEDAMFTPQEFLAYQKKIGKHPKFKPPAGVIFCYANDAINYFLKNYKVRKVEGFIGDMYLLDDTKGRIGIIGNFGIGAPVAAALLEELIAFGVKKFITVGTAGTLQKHVRIGSIVVCERAIRDEGTSYHYLKHSKYAYASKELTEKIKKALERLGQKYFSGTSWTIDAPYRETVAEARQYQKEGVIAVDMEAAALFAVAKYRAVELGAIFAISDSLAELQWKPKFHSKKLKKSLEAICKIALDVLLDER
jgi:uridine phosphorylase